jgi:transcriptional regulator with XRE-family HTH domain
MAITGQQQTADIIAPPFMAEGLPVFRGLDDVLVPDKEIAAIAGVTPPTFSRWRTGRARVPEKKLIFLTLLLAHWLDELESKQGNCQRRIMAETKLNTTRRCLFQQEVINQTLPPESVREGSHLFRKWWFQENESLYK